MGWVYQTANDVSKKEQERTNDVMTTRSDAQN